MSNTLAERVARMRAAGKPIPDAWSHIKVPVPVKKLVHRSNWLKDGTPDLETFLASVPGISKHKLCARLMGYIASWTHYGHSVPQEWWDALKDVCEPKRFKKFRKRLAKNKPAQIHRPIFPRVRVTRSVRYTYDPADDKKLAEFYASPEWAMARYEALRLHGARCQCCGADPSDGKTVLNVDHIKPARVFWDLRLNISNLQILCGPCNQGKGARHDDDWRPKRHMAMFDMDRTDRI